jgi:broad specificity phosphatase PhoE
MNTAHARRIPPPDSECLLRLILLRHGQPPEEVQGRCYGKLDVGLSLEGRKQIRDRVGFLRSLNPDALYTSTCKRAIESAEELSRELHLQAEAYTELCEISFGAFEGLTYTEIESRYPVEFKQWMERPTAIKFPGGESFEELKTRTLKFLALISQVQRGRTVLAVAHAGVNRLILANAMGLSGDNLFRIDQAYAAVNVIDYFPEYALVRLMNG